MTSAQWKALKLLGKHGTASVTNATATSKGGLSIHHATAMALIRHSFAAGSETGLTITEKGMRRAGLIQETPAQRRQRRAAEALAAQERGEWKPAPAGASAAADRLVTDERRYWANLIDDMKSNREEARFEREMIEFAKAWKLPRELIDECRRKAELCEAAAAKAEVELAELRRKREAWAS